MLSTFDTFLYTVLKVFEALIPFKLNIILLEACTVFLTETGLSDTKTILNVSPEGSI